MSDGTPAIHETEDLAKFGSVFQAIRANPYEFFAERSLGTFDAFWRGFSERSASGRARRMFSPGGFHQFVSDQYKNDTTHGAVWVIDLYHRDQTEAWNRYFELLDTYSSAISIKDTGGDASAPETFERVVSGLLQHPAMYVGYSSFHLIATYLEGWLRATRDMQYEESDFERRFRDLLAYIEEFDINLPGPRWSSIIWYWTMNNRKAIELFSTYLDEYVTQGMGSVEKIESNRERRLEARRKA